MKILEYKQISPNQCKTTKILKSVCLTRKCVTKTNFHKYDAYYAYKKIYFLNFLENFNNDDSNLNFDGSGFYLHPRQRLRNSLTDQIVQSLLKLPTGLMIFNYITIKK